LSDVEGQDIKGPRWMPWHWSRRRTWRPTKRDGELEASIDPSVSEWGNPPSVNTRDST